MQLRKGESKFEQATAGKQPAVIAKFEDIGTHETKFGDRAQCRITYVLAECDNNGRQKRLCQTLTASLHEKSKLSGVLTQILGSVPDEFDSDVLIGKQVVLNLGTVVKDGQELCGCTGWKRHSKARMSRFLTRRSATVACRGRRRMTNAESYQAFDLLLGLGLVRPSGRFNEHGEILYECVPDAEMSDEAKAYAAYLYSRGNPTRVN